MQSKSNSLDFKGQHFYIGIDTHKSNWKIAIRSNNLLLKRYSMNPDPEELTRYMNKSYPGGIYHSVYEAGYSGYWIDRALNKSGLRNIIVNPADVPSTNKERDRKSDPVDCNKLSRELNSGSLTGIYVPDPHQESIRVLSRFLFQYSRRSTQVKCRIKALLSFLGMDSLIDVKQYWSKAYIEKLSELEFEQPANKFVLRSHLEEIEHIRKHRLAILREMRKISKINPVIKLLRTIPGVGVIISFTLYTELMSMDRFNSLDELASYVGLVPSTASSDEKTTNKGITNRHCVYLRYLIIEAAWRAVSVDPVFTHGFNKLCNRMSKQRAIIRMSKKLLNRIRFVWKNQEPYATGVVQVYKEVAKDNKAIAA